jgi:hypothetical protein
MAKMTQVSLECYGYKPVGAYLEPELEEDRKKIGDLGPRMILIYSSAPFITPQESSF